MIVEPIYTHFAASKCIAAGNAPSSDRGASGLTIHVCVTSGTYKLKPKKHPKENILRSVGEFRCPLLASHGSPASPNQETKIPSSRVVVWYV